MGKVIKLDQRVEIIAADVEELKSSGGGGGTSEGYTKAEADAKFETITNAAATYQTISGMSSYGTKTWAAESFQPIGDYLTATDIADMATKTWVGSQSFLTQSAASSTYLTQSDASSTYLPSATARQVPAPAASDDGKVLTAASNGTYSWETASGGGGLSVETDGTNYWITVNGVRLYFASSAPTGTIPDGSYGIGW